jgi:hypothetical protein
MKASDPPHGLTFRSNRIPRTRSWLCSGACLTAVSTKAACTTARLRPRAAASRGSTMTAMSVKLAFSARTPRPSVSSRIGPTGCCGGRSLRASVTYGEDSGASFSVAAARGRGDRFFTPASSRLPFGDGGRTGRKGTVRVSRGDQPQPIPLGLEAMYIRFFFVSSVLRSQPVSLPGRKDLVPLILPASSGHAEGHNPRAECFSCQGGS